MGGEDRLLRVPLRAVGGAVRGEGGKSVRPALACDPAVFFSVCLWIWSVGTRVYTLARGRAVLVHGPLACVVWVALAAAVLWHDTRGKPVKKIFLVLSTQYSLKE